MCAPKGAGFLYARPEVQHLLKPLVVSSGYESKTPSGSTLVDHHEWMGTRDLSAFLSVPAAIKFQEEHHWARVRADCHGLACRALSLIGGLTGQSSYYPDDRWYVQMFAAQLPPTVHVSAFKSALDDEYRIEAPVHEWNGKKLIRISIQGHNTEGDIKALMSALKRLLPERV
ncbi:MAG TPA: aminotransferase class V-fold PLP-dependent enzyme [Anaerolineales bacterium]|nr:aminotransferase class V-fold PLP-dependent enzyme [Anaerolineales bacterium]